MKKISELLKPFFSVIFGALLFLCHFNWLMAGGGYLAAGIIAVVVALYFIAVGLFSALMGEKMSDKTKGLLNALGTSLYPLFLGTYFLLDLIVAVKNNFAIGPMGWTIAIFSIIVSLAVAGLYLFAYFKKNEKVIKLTFVFTALFILAMFLDVLVVYGNPITLGDIVVLRVVLYAVFTAILLGAVGALKPENKPVKAE